MAIRFYLNARSSTGQSPVSIALVALRGEQQIKVMTPVRVRPRDWSKRQQRVKASVPGATELNASLARLRTDAERLMLDHPDDDELRAALRGRLGRAPTVPQPTILTLYSQFLSHKKVRTRKSTLQVYEALQKHLQDFLPDPEVQVSAIRPTWLDDFAAYLAGRGLANSTVNKLVTRTKGFLRWLTKQNLLEREPKSKSLPTIRNAAIYLTADELARLIHLDLTGEQPGYRAARDLFVVAAVTGQRFSDVQAMRWEDIHDTVWHLQVKKTNVTVRVPLTSPALRILEARSGESKPLPRLSNQKTNLYLKHVCRLAGIDDAVTVTVQKGGERERVTGPKWERITSHVARKTFVTLALQSGMPMNELLGFTHEDLRTLRLYAGQDETRRRKQLNRVFGGL